MTRRLWTETKTSLAVVAVCWLASLYTDRRWRR